RRRDMWRSPVLDVCDLPAPRWRVSHSCAHAFSPQPRSGSLIAMLDHGPAAWLGVLALVASIGVGACADLDEVELGVCGNHVHEPEFGEDCDGSAARFGPDAKCGAPTSATPCRLTCNPVAATTGCPDGWGCGLDGVCRRPTAELSFVQLPGQARGIGDLDGDGRDDVILRGQSGEAQVAFFNENRSLA